MSKRSENNKYIRIKEFRFKELLDMINDRVKIKDLLEYYNIDCSDNNFKCYKHNPMKNFKTMTIVKDSNITYCFSCLEKDTVFSLTQYYEGGISFMEAVQVLCSNNYIDISDYVEKETKIELSEFSKVVSQIKFYERRLRKLERYRNKEEITKCFSNMKEEVLKEKDEEIKEESLNKLKSYYEKIINSTNEENNKRYLKEKHLYEDKLKSLKERLMNFDEKEFNKHEKVLISKFDMLK